MSLSSRNKKVKTGLLRYYQPVKKDQVSPETNSSKEDESIGLLIDSDSDDKSKSVPESEIIDLVESPEKTCTFVPLKTWTEKYRPSCSDDWIGDKSALSSLSSFINRPRRSNNNDDDDDDDELLKLSDTRANAVLLTGYHGWGKTCLVYAIAEQSNKKVLEMNSSSRRSGKIITSSLKEATQTYLLKLKGEKCSSTSSSSNDISRFFLKKSSQSTLNESDEQSKSNTSSQSKKLDQQIILFDDVDAIIEGKEESKDEDLDVGFWRSLKQLIRESKVPVILTATEFEDNILNSKLNDLKVLRINITKPNLLDVRNHLLNICSNEFPEECNINLQSNESIDRLDYLITSSSYDLRKCINQLNFTGESFFAPISVPKVHPAVKRKRGRNRSRTRNISKFSPFIDSIRTSDLTTFSSRGNFDLSNLVLGSASNIQTVKQPLSQILDEVSIRNKLDLVMNTTNNFINESFTSLSSKPSLLTCKSDQILDVLPFLSVICKVEASKKVSKESTSSPERKKTRRQSRLQGLPYFESIESFKLDAQYQSDLCSVYDAFNSSFEFYDTDATDIDE